MPMKPLRNFLHALLITAAAASAPLAHATLTLTDGTVFDGFVSGGGSAYRLTLRMDFTDTADDSVFLGDRIEAWSLQLPGAATSALVSAPVDLAWSVYNAGKAVGGSNGCGNGAVTTVCVDRNDNSQLDGTGPLVTKTVFDWVVDIAFASPQDFTAGMNFHLLTVVWDDKQRAIHDGWKKDATLVSADLGVFRRKPPDEGGSVPEPTTLALLGLGLAGVAALRRRGRAAHRPT